jgi:hypothetical protein
MGKEQALQSTRKEAIEVLIERYKKLANEIFDQVGKPLPNFEDYKDEEDQIITSTEQKLFAFIDVRKGALETGNNILSTINELERELNDPKYYENKLIEDSKAPGETVSQHPSKRNAKK